MKKPQQIFIEFSNGDLYKINAAAIILFRANKKRKEKPMDMVPAIEKSIKFFDANESKLINWAQKHMNWTHDILPHAELVEHNISHQKEWKNSVTDYKFIAVD